MIGIKIHKNIKLLYYAKNALLLLIPRWCFQNRLQGMILPKAKDDIDYLKKRVNYYNKLKDTSALPKKVKSLHDLKRGKKHTTYFFDTHDNNLKYILIKKLKLSLHQLNKYGIDKLSIEFSNDNINWEKPSYDWLLNETVEIIDPSNSIILNSSTTKDMFSLDVAYGTNVGENYPVQFLDSGGTTENYQINENYEYYFDAGANETISILIKNAYNGTLY